MLTALPEAFLRRMQAQLGADFPAYLAAMEHPPRRGLRLNPQKPAVVDGLSGVIPWEPDGRYLPFESTLGAHPLHEAGAYYLQEPSAMVPARVLAPRPGETVLDLCAAPGGKSTQFAALMNGEGLLVSNEIVPSRAQILSRNLERMGVPNALAVSADPRQLAQLWPGLFDAILVDAPCSGEGMFRRHPETIAEWDEQSPARCAARQSAILESACALLAPGGRLCYSTCTLNEEENEGVLQGLLRLHPDMEPMEFSVAVGDGRALHSQDGGLHLYPYELEGEGHFVALLHKTGGKRETALEPQPFALPPKEALAPCADFGVTPNAALGDALIAVPPLPPLRGVKVLRAGVTLGRCKGKLFTPDHALALCWRPPTVPRVPISEADARAYQRGETLPAPEGLCGWALPTLAGLPLGWVKISDGQMKNHYPKGLRRG
ncbi:MAG: RsmB/NOP family class I SAM-dependent RNA methyltransferase [Eubacteriales bacterium]|nr:RsmB/NOP family class I SAM-dependent RNA methyltransferase [Eubacteriales bacterium]